MQNITEENITEAVLERITAGNPRMRLALEIAPLLEKLADETRGMDHDARESAASLAQAFRWALAPIPRSILDSRSPTEVQKYILALYADGPLTGFSP
jgi:hypothetical protein